HRVHRRLRPGLRPGQVAFPVRDRRPAAWRGRVERRKPVLRPVGLRLPSQATTMTTNRGETMRSTTRNPRTRNLRKSVLCMAMGLCLSSLAAAPVMAQSVTGAVAGEAQAGTVVTISNPATGFTRSVTADADGHYRIGQLPPGDYTLTAGSGDPIAVSVSLGGTTMGNLTSEGAVNLATVQVVGSRVANRVAGYSTESA